jgi:non-specific serine/threonine protein kinase/serine/threonine-protein kinase
MEFIEGQPVTSFCESRRLPLRGRLELFIRVCEGVQHAHQKGVIHRDLKPGNILVAEVDGRPLPKIIDFGIATAASRSLAAGAALGELERAGTPDYMSPEQAGLAPGIEVDTRSDVYSLGVLLYELLAGRRPGAGEDTTAGRHTASNTLQPPSAQIATLAPGNDAGRAHQLGVGRRRLRRLLREELDWVVLRAMRRDRSERYASAADLAADLRRFLEGRPLQAVPPSRRYVLSKYLARHRVAVAAGTAVGLAVLAGLGLSLYGLQQAREQRVIAERRSAELERVAAFQQSMLTGIDIQAMGAGLAAGLREQVAQSAPERLPLLEDLLASTSAADLARALIDRNLLASAEQAITRDFADQPALAADLRESVAEVHTVLGLPARAEAIYAQVADYREQALGAVHPSTLDARGEQAYAMGGAGRAKEGHALLESLVAKAEVLSAEHPVRIDIESKFAESIAGLGDRPRARELQQALYDRARASRGERDPQVLSLLNNLGISMARTGDLPAAREVMERLFVLRGEVLGPRHADTLSTQTNLAVMRAMMGDLEQALPLQRDLVAVQTERLGAEHPLTLDQRGNLANMLLDAGELDEAEALMRAVLEARSRVLGQASAPALRSRLNLASLLARRGRFEEALALEREVIAGRQRLLGPAHPDTLFVLVNHAGTLGRAGQPAASLVAIRDAMPRVREVLGMKHAQAQAALAVEGNALLDLGRPAEARGPFQELLSLRIDALGESHPETAVAAWGLARAKRAAGDGDSGRELEARFVAPLRAIPASERSAAQRSAVDRIEQDSPRRP